MDWSAERSILGAFIAPRRRSRYLALLESKRGRLKLRKLLAHGGDLDERFLRHLPDSVRDPKEVFSWLTKLGAPKLCYLMSESEELDGKYLDLGEALVQVMHGECGSLVSCLTGRLAFYQGELLDERYLLERAEARVD
jgi:hypothetical protein